MKKSVTSIITAVLVAILLWGCNSVSTFNYSTSQTVIRSAIAESKTPNELKNKSLIVFITNDKRYVGFDHIKKADYGDAVIDKDSFAAFLVDPGEYSLGADKFEFEANKCYFFFVDQYDYSPISVEVFQKSGINRYLVEQSNYYGEVHSVENYFSNKVSWWEVTGHNIGVVIGKTFIVLGCVVLAGGLVFIALVEAKAGRTTTTTTIINEIRPNVYGPGIHSDEYGRPVKVVPAY